MLYRSTGLDKLAGADEAPFAALGIRSIYDLRTEAEREAEPDRVPDGTEYVVADVLKDSSGAAPAQLLRILSDPKAAEEMLGGGKSIEIFRRGYREIVSLPSAHAAYRRLFSDLTEERHRPALFHCTTGKERTGWAAAAMLTVLGVPDDLVMREYLLTNTELRRISQRPWGSTQMSWPASVRRPSSATDRRRSAPRFADWCRGKRRGGERYLANRSR